MIKIEKILTNGDELLREASSYMFPNVKLRGMFSNPFNEPKAKFRLSLVMDKGTYIIPPNLSQYLIEDSNYDIINLPNEYIYLGDEFRYVNISEFDDKEFIKNYSQLFNDKKKFIKTYLTELDRIIESITMEKTKSCPILIESYSVDDNTNKLPKNIQNIDKLLGYSHIKEYNVRLIIPKLGVYKIMDELKYDIVDDKIIINLPNTYYDFRDTVGRNTGFITESELFNVSINGGSITKGYESDLYKLISMIRNSII